MTAIAQPKLNLREEAAPTNIKSYVFVKITPEALAPCLEFMLSRQFAFEVQYKKEESSAQASSIQTPRIDMMPFPKTPEVKRNIANEVHDKYMSGISNEPLPDLFQIADEFGISLQSLKALFKKTYNQTIYQAYMQSRMDKSAELLRQGYKACQVSQMVGYSENSAIKFNKMFQKSFGITPKKYQLKQLNKKVNESTKG